MKFNDLDWQMRDTVLEWWRAVLSSLDWLIGPSVKHAQVTCKHSSWIYSQSLNSLHIFPSMRLLCVPLYAPTSTSFSTSTSTSTSASIYSSCLYNTDASTYFHDINLHTPFDVINSSNTINPTDLSSVIIQIDF